MSTHTSTTHTHPSQASSCVTLLYTPKGQPLVERIVADIRSSNQPPLSPQEVKGFESQAHVGAPQLPCEWLLAVGAPELHDV